MLPVDVVSILEERLRTRVIGATSLGGGCIANASRVDTENGPVFVKWSRGDVAATFPAESKGLATLRQAGSSLHVPEPRFVHERTDDAPGVFVASWIESGQRNPGFWDDFGRELARMHRFTADRYGFASDNFIGRLPQINAWLDSWPDFFVTRRLEPQIKLAQDSGRWDSSWTRQMKRLKDRIDEILPLRPEASVLHGDLWSGNYMPAQDGRAAIFDPAVYFGHRETDLAMTELFGGFDPRFYAAYRDAWPLEPGYSTRRDVYNLYHLINHLNHFGGGYAGSVERILSRF